MGWAERRGIQKDVTRGGLRPFQGSVAGLNHVEQQSHGHGRGKDAHQRHKHRRQPGSCKFSSHGLGQEQPEALYEHLDAYLQHAWSDDIKVELNSPGGSTVMNPYWPKKQLIPMLYAAALPRNVARVR